MTTAELITLTRDRFGEDSTTATQVSDTQILKFLNQRMVELGCDADLLPSAWTTSCVSGQQQYSVPTEYTSVESISIYQTTSPNIKWWLTKVDIEDIDPTRTSGSPIRFAVWGLNVSGDNSPAFWLDPIPNFNGSSDLTCYGFQTPKTMVSGGQGPEARVRWQYAAVTGAVALIYQRLAESSPQLMQMWRMAEQDWQLEKKAAQDETAQDLMAPSPPKDTMGYTKPWPY